MLEVKEIKKTYSKREILKGVSFNLEKGKIRALVGPNGSGKTTLFKVLTNLTNKDSGSVIIDGKTYKDRDIFKKISFFADETILDGNLFGMDYLSYIGKTYNKNEEDIKKVIDEIGIRNFVGTRIKTYSLGMKKKLMLAMALVPENPYIFLDEPISGLDPTSVANTKKLIKEKASQGMSFIISSHQLRDMDDITNDILFLKEGKIIEESLDSEKFLYLIVNDKDRLINLFKDENIVYKDDLVSLNKLVTVDRVVNILSKNSIEILDIKVKNLSSQEKYDQIFSIEK